jgi:hypothetical protein
MDKQHPHFGATYRTIPETDGTFCIEVTIPGAPMVKVTGFSTEALAHAWIAGHEREIATGTMAREKLHLWKKQTTASQ